ncbi:cytochrome d ubiquinol oxidase subunit II [Emcibacter sp. SYSU 3D8]|uniref:cytochrome d ubiquinol oxidase subunit II n=1 Tax=Emcibacter sp. SYSU 3D8 TaxID=3133969 RepID=UPI0031FF1221
MDVTLIWTAVIAFGVAMYIIMDGFDLGVGILFPFTRREEWRDVMMDSIAPVWDGNETWLVLGGAGLFGAFPLAYATVLPALYVPLILFLVALVFRGIAFEFRHGSNTSKWAWNLSFAAGSTIAAFAQGLVLGSFVQGLPIENGVFVGNALSWLTPFSIFTGVALVIGYGLLGSTWLIGKTEGDLQDWMFKAAKGLTIGLLAAIIVVSLWTPLLQPEIAARWFSMPNLLLLAPIPILTAAVALLLLLALKNRREGAPFFLSISLFLLSYLGLAVSLWPYIVPRAFTIWEAAAPPETQIFLLVGALLFVPLVLTYTIIVYRVFRGKVRHGEGYHH